MILPTKHISTRNSLLGIGATILVRLNHPRTVTSLWSSVSRIPEISTFERFVLALDLLYIIGAVELEDGLLRKCQP